MVTFKEFFSFKNNRFFWLNLIAMVVVIVAAPLGTLQWLDNYTRHGEAVVVPDVKGMNLRIAENELDKQSLKSIVIDSSYVKGIAPGAILEQNPAGGSKVKSGRTVYLTVNADSALTVGNGNETMPEDSALVNESGTANDDKPVVDESWF